MKIVIGCDPNAQDFKEQLIPFIEGLGHEVTDFGSDDTIYANSMPSYLTKIMKVSNCNSTIHKL